MIIDSFLAPLPNFKVHDEAVYQKASVAAPTKEEELLRALKWEETEEILKHGRNYLRSTRLEEDSSFANRQPSRGDRRRSKQKWM